MWSVVESKVAPAEVDETSSEVYVYIRKDIREIEKDEETIYEDREQKIKKDDWEMYKQILTNASDLSDVQDALIELAEMVVG